MKHILFDLDGCLTDSFEGISNCVIYAMEKFGVKIEDVSSIRPFVGPPLVYSFEKYMNLSKEDAHKATEYYRERYKDIGIFENRVYEGVEEMLSSLKKDGYKISLCTSKPQPFAKRIMEKFGLDKYFDNIFGATFDEKISKKEDVIKYVLENIKEKDAIMVGDTHFDVTGAHKNNIKCIGVLYGYGTKEELIGAKADFLAELPEKIYEIIKNTEN